jgi:hypothetical protein
VPTAFQVIDETGGIEILDRPDRELGHMEVHVDLALMIGKPWAAHGDNLSNL